MKFAIILTILVCVVSGCQPKEERNQNAEIVSTEAEIKEKPLKIILLIGDGMGLSQLSSAYFFGEEEPNFSRFKRIALHKSRSSSHKITDSAAGATAFSCGKKTYNGAIGVGPDSLALETIVEYVSDLGWHTGVVATSTITHATPGSFYAHVESRSEQAEIARQLCFSEIDFFIGGGKRYFNERLDDLNYIDTLKEQGFIFDSVLPHKIDNYEAKYGFLISRDGMKGKHEGRANELLESTQLALDYFDNQNDSFFLMIESSQIDWGGHENIGDYVIQETLEFDKVVGSVLDYAEQDGNTLVIVTADHETGGFTLSGKPRVGKLHKMYNDYNTIEPTFSTDGHSCALIPVFSYGPGSQEFTSVIENTFIFDVMKGFASGVY